MSLTGKNVVFVGGLGGIGYMACRQFMTKNLNSLVVLDAVENSAAIKALQEINLKCKVYYIKLDILNKVAVKSAIAETVSKVKYIDVLVNGAGILSDREIELTININLTGLIFTTMEALPYMDKNQKGRGGLVVNIASVLGLEPSPSCAVYSGSKFGVVGFTRSLADSFYYKLTGVSFITFCPGLTETPLKNNLKGNDTFEYSKPLSEKFLMARTQTSDVCGEHLVRVAENGRNGEIWISDLETLSAVEPKVFWEMKMQ